MQELTFVVMILQAVVLLSSIIFGVVKAGSVIEGIKQVINNLMKELNEIKQRLSNIENLDFPVYRGEKEKFKEFKEHISKEVEKIYSILDDILKEVGDLNSRITRIEAVLNGNSKGRKK